MAYRVAVDACGVEPRENGEPPIDHDEQKFGPGEEKIIDIPKQDKLVDTGGPPLLLVGIVMRVLRR